MWIAERGGRYLARVYDIWVDGGSKTGCEGERAVDRGGSEGLGERARSQDSSWEHLRGNGN